MTARNELAELIASVTIDTTSGDVLRVHPDGETPVFEGDQRTADALVAAGYTKPRIITTVAELDALPDGTVVMDGQGEVARKLVYGWRVLVSESGFDAWLSDPLEETYLPATVLHEGTQP